jgi:hypothetical protein
VVCVIIAMGAVLGVAAPWSCAPFGVGDELEGGAGDAAFLEGGAGVDAASSAYARTVLRDSPLAYWRLDETVGPIARSLVDGRYVALILGTPKLGVKGAIANEDDTAIELTGPNQGFKVVDTTAFDFPGTESYSLEAWVNLHDIDQNYRHVFSKDDETAGRPREEYGVYVIMNGSDNGLAFERYVGAKAFANYIDTSMTNVVALGKWHHVVATYDGTNLKLYVDGAKTVVSDSRPQQPIPRPFFFGTKNEGGGELLGAIDEVAVYDKALTDAQVATHYKAGR